ncbi:MAG: ribonuclease D [Methyloligellaceae bacterium]
MNIHLHKGDLPADLKFSGPIAVDSETMGLNPLRDRLCVLQLSAGDGEVHLVQFAKGAYDAPVLKKLMCSEDNLKIFHFARFDLAAIYHHLHVMTQPVFCTKIASKLVRTYTDRHGLKDLCREMLNVEMSKQQQSSDWGADELTEEQCKYAASDVLHLHELMEKLKVLLERENRTQFAEECFKFLPTRAILDLKGWHDMDIFSH